MWFANSEKLPIPGPIPFPDPISMIFRFDDSKRLSKQLPYIGGLFLGLKGKMFLIICFTGKIADKMFGWLFVLVH